MIKQYGDIMHRCFRCGYCKLTEEYTAFNCPPHRVFKFESYSPGGRMWLTRALLNNEITNSEHYREIMFSCTMCANCVEHCIFTFKDDLVNIFVAARGELVNAGVIPPGVRDYLKNIQISGNPFKLPATDRDKWANNLEVPEYTDQEYLLYVGCVGSYDEQGQKSSQAVAKLLLRAGVSFGILGKNEICDGNEVRFLGDQGLFEYLAKQNIEQFHKLGIKKIITVDPHAYNALKNDYPFFGGGFDVSHYTQIVEALIDSERFELSGYPVIAAYHDPCYLGRHNGEYEAPRKILQSIPGLKLIELDNSGENGLCCGGGGGNFFTDILGSGEESPARTRVRQAHAAGVNIIAVACPLCAKMLTDAVKTEHLSDVLEVFDIAEVVTRAF
ncbi:MAG: (Fe-S)-binding protein [Deltaproteobacteria bacterium]|nr:(Fe-S)-binding protein [Deltaproteobacteria bacterium]